MSRAGWLLPLLILSRTVQTGAQSSNVTECIPRYDWSINSRNQTPCLVAAYLEQDCGTDEVIVNSIPPKNHYLGPTFAQANPCTCNVVVYSLISACGGCQDRTFTSWKNWTLNCAMTDPKTFPRTIPAAVEVPTWAYLDISLSSDTFDPVAAEAVAKATQSSSASVTQPSTSRAADSPIITGTQSSARGSESHAGAIAGGVVGGVAFISTLCLVAFWVFLRRGGGRQKQQHKIDLDEEIQPPTRGDTGDPFVTHSVLSGGPIISSPSYFETRESNVFSSVTSPMYTTFAGRTSLDSTRYAGSQVTRGAYSGAAEI